VGKFRVKIEKQARVHLELHRKSGNKASIAKIEVILKELTEHPYAGTGQPERLKHDLSGFWSRRINHKDRMVYQVNENIVTVEVVSAMGHYSDK
jgi:toxin YoeB